MRLSAGLVIIVSVFIVASGCKSNSGPSSAEGAWTYTTSDSKISVNFELVKTSSGSLDIQNQTIKVNGSVYNAEKQIGAVTLPTIGSMRVNANDTKATYGYYILFINGKVSSDFKHIEVPDGEYTFPWGTVVPLKNISIVRP